MEVTHVKKETAPDQDGKSTAVRASLRVPRDPELAPKWLQKKRKHISGGQKLNDSGTTGLKDTGYKIRTLSPLLGPGSSWPVSDGLQEGRSSPRPHEAKF